MTAQAVKAPAGAKAIPAERQQASAPPNPTTTSSEPTESLTPAQKKAKAKAEKTARRAQVKENKAPTPLPELVKAKDTSIAGKTANSTAKKDGLQIPLPWVKQGPNQRTPTGGRRSSLAEKDVRSSTPEPFSHLSMAKRVPSSHATKDVHPAVLVVGQQMATFTVKDSIARLKATLLAFRKVIESYETPMGNSLSRHFVPHVLNPQIEYLTECRPMCFAMGNAIRLLKTQVNNFDINTPEELAKEGLLESIDSFIKEKITFAELIITRNAADLVSNGDAILTYGRARLVEKTLLQARKGGKDFLVLIVDDPYDHAGQDLAKALKQVGIRVTYWPHLGGLRSAVKRATNVFLGVEALFANGSLYAAAGTADLALAARDNDKGVTALCETINFDRERVSVEALTYSEIDPEGNSPDTFRLLFDTTQDRLVTAVITEYESGTGNSPAEAILSILRKQEDPTVS